MLNIDLHSHSRVSDGVLGPADLVRRACDNGVKVLALTDHDEVAGVTEAKRTASEMGIELVSGVEISITWAGTSIHIVGLTKKIRYWSTCFAETVWGVWNGHREWENGLPNWVSKALMRAP